MSSTVHAAGSAQGSETIQCRAAESLRGPGGKQWGESGHRTGLPPCGQLTSLGLIAFVPPSVTYIICDTALVDTALVVAQPQSTVDITYGVLDAF